MFQNWRKFPQCKIRTKVCTKYYIFVDCRAARRRSAVQPPVAVAEQAAVPAAAVAAAVEAEVAGQPATGLPAVISSAEVTPSRSIRPCIPPTGSTTWTTFTTSSRPPRTVPTPRYTVITLACTCSEIIRTIGRRWTSPNFDHVALSAVWNLFHHWTSSGYWQRALFLLLRRTLWKKASIKIWQIND